MYAKWQTQRPELGEAFAKNVVFALQRCYVHNQKLVRSRNEAAHATPWLGKPEMQQCNSKEIHRTFVMTCISIVPCLWHCDPCYGDNSKNDIKSEILFIQTDFRK